jgi:hypothetical protein
MDHLLQYQTSDRPSIEVPYVCRHPYDDGTFAEYPRRQGVQRYITRLDLHLSNEEINSFLQTWLFFGLLSEIFEDFVADDFIRSSPTRSLVTTELLPQYTQRWRTLLRQMLPGDRRLKIVKASKCLQEVFNFTSLHFETLEDAPTPRPEI